jgi:mannose-6-phosphate isomerase-like protein (cupin superfamily)
MGKVTLSEKFGAFQERWNPKIVAELNGQYVKLVKIQGEFVWHKHQREDELFLVVKGAMTIQFRDREVPLNEGEFLVVPAGVEHKPVAANETWVMLFEPKSTLNTGDILNDRTVADLEKI